MKAQIFSEGIPSFSVPDVFEVGPFLNVDVSFNLGVSSSENLEAGVNYALPNASAHLDLVSKDPNASHWDEWTPTTDETFNMSTSQIDLNATFGVPISLSLGINILDGKFNQNISNTETPNIQLDTSLKTPGHSKREDRNHARDLVIRQTNDQYANGVQEIINASDQIAVNVFDLWATPIASWSTQFFPPAS